MLLFKLEQKGNMSIKQFAKMPLVDIMDDDRHFTIFVDDQVYFDDIYFPIREFVKYALGWLKRKNDDFAYSTIDNEDNPLIAFYRLKSGWKLESVWQQFECDKVFSDDDVKSFISEIISHVIAC